MDFGQCIKIKEEKKCAGNLSSSRTQNQSRSEWRGSFCLLLSNPEKLLPAIVLDGALHNCPKVGMSPQGAL